MSQEQSQVGKVDAKFRVSKAGLPRAIQEIGGVQVWAEEQGQSWFIALRCSVGECAPDRHRGDKRGELRGWVLRGPGKARHMEASWNQGKGLSVGGGEGTMLEAA